jgi:TonB family protein
MHFEHSRHAGAAFAVLLLHAIAVSALVRSFDREKSVEHGRNSDAVLVSIFTPPRIIPAEAPSSLSLSIRFISLSDTLNQFDIKQLEVENATSINAAALMASPSIQDDSALDRAQFARDAGLLPGEGATVVLRVEVLETGLAGRVEIDISSGSGQMDRAAVAYTRTRHWSAGRTVGSPHAMWIRFGVRLQA